MSQREFAGILRTRAKAFFAIVISLRNKKQVILCFTEIENDGKIPDYSSVDNKDRSQHLACRRYANQYNVTYLRHAGCVRNDYLYRAIFPIRE